jgi:hypothetical protein
MRIYSCVLEIVQTKEALKVGITRYLLLFFTLILERARNFAMFSMFHPNDYYEVLLFL